ncbi:hypothetical protein ACH518_04625 [Methylomonas sp. HW2-6]|uniref:hypothetical protein n=1 Tax=Methylomonas sp. HW2-6 TaxID=3376687 RepID=UPI0040417705
MRGHDAIKISWFSYISLEDRIPKQHPLRCLRLLVDGVLASMDAVYAERYSHTGRQQWPILSFNDLVTVLEHLLPRRQLISEQLADVINKRHDMRQKARESHYKRSQVALE